MHVGAYGEHLGVSQIVIPYTASVHGAFGLVTSDIAHEDQITQPLRAPFDVEAIARIYAQLEERIVAQLQAEGFDRSQMRLNRAVDMRYRRQVHILTSPFVGAEVTADSLEQTVDMFERLYEEKYGPQSAYREAGIELVSYRAAARASSASTCSASSSSQVPIPQRRSSSASRRGWTSRASSKRCRATTSSACGLGTRFRGQPSSGRRSRHWSSRPPRLRASTSIATSSSRWTGEDGCGDGRR